MWFGTVAPAPAAGSFKLADMLRDGAMAWAWLAGGAGGLSEADAVTRLLRALPAIAKAQMLSNPLDVDAIEVQSSISMHGRQRNLDSRRRRRRGWPLPRDAA